MRYCASFGVLAAVSMGVALASLAGCQSVEQQRVEARDAAGSLRQSLKGMPPRVDATMNALFQATSGDNTNRAVRYADFKSKFKALQSDAKTVRSHAERARNDAAKYFKDWANEAVAADPAKRQQMMAAVEGRQANYDVGLSYLDGGRDSYIALVSDLTDIEKTLDANLGQANSASVEKLVNTAKLHSIDLKDYISVLSDRIDAALSKK